MRHSITNQKSNIWLKKGRIAALRAGTLKGLNAAAELLGCITFESRFFKGANALPEVRCSISTAKFIRRLESIEAKTTKMKFALPGGELKCLFDPSSVKNSVRLKTKELDIIVKLDGKKSIDDLISEASATEFEVWSMLYRFHRNGWIVPFGENRTGNEGMIATFAMSARERLAELLGPIAQIVWNEALEKSAFSCCGQEIDHIFTVAESVLNQLKDREKSSFEPWVSNWLRNQVN